MTEKKRKERHKTLKESKNEKTNNTKESIVFVGKKPVMNYVIACLTYFNAGSSSVVVKARGLSITRAVDTVELLRRAFLKDLQLQDIGFHTEELARDEGERSRVSAIEITLAKP